MARVEKTCETCAYYLPMGGCAFGGFLPCDKWKISLSYDNEPTLW